MSAATGRCWATAGFALTRTRVKTAIYNAAGMCQLHLVITRPHIHIHLVHYKLYGIIPYRLSVGAFSVTATARLDLRLSTKDRERIDRAAALAGLPLAAFVRSAVLREADRMVAAESVATLSLAESKRFLAALGKPFAPNAELRRAMKCGNELGI
jgi:uncharacterized protein (DUF1778 family)